MSQKNPNLAELPNLIPLNEVWRRTGVPPYKIILICNEIWLDCTPVDEGYRWQGQRLIPGNRDPLVPMTGKYKLTEDSQLELAERTIDPLRSRGFPLVANLTMETENGFLTLHSTTKGRCPPLPTPKILVPEEVLEKFLAVRTQTYDIAPKTSPNQNGRKVIKDALDELLLEILQSGVNSGEGVYRIIVREMNSTQRNFDKQRILLQKIGDRRRGFRWQKAGLEQTCTMKTLRNRIAEIRQHFPEL